MTTALAIVDDNKLYRESLSERISGNYRITELEGPFETPDALVQAIKQGHEAALCDYQLTTRNYAPCSGAEAVARLYEQRFPAILVTRFKNSDVELVRPYRRKIPVVLDNTQVEPEIIDAALNQCLMEFKNRFVPTRRPWPTLVQIVDIDEPGPNAFIKAVVPAWRPDEGIRFPRNMIPEQVAEGLKEGSHVLAEANLGAETQIDLFLDNFSVAPKEARHV